MEGEVSEVDIVREKYQALSGMLHERALRLWAALEAKSVQESFHGLTVSVCHLPPGTSKWNKIEHRMFCHITENWRAQPLKNLAVIVNLVGKTSTTTGLKVKASVDAHEYPTGKKVSD